jgi:hypothetical protein
VRCCHTDDQALHLVFPHDFHAQRFCYAVIVLEGTAARRHDAELLWCRAIVVFVVCLQLAHKLDACVYPVGLELEEVEAAAYRIVAIFA